MSSAPAAFKTLRQLTATFAAIAPRRLAEAALTMLALAVTEGVGLLLLVPLLQLVGVDANNGPLSGIAVGFSRIFHAAQIQPTLGSVLTVYVVACIGQSLLQRRHTVLADTLQQEVVATLRMRLHRAVACTRWVDFVRLRSSDLTHVLTDEVQRVGFGAYWLLDLAVAGLTSIVYIAFAFRLAPAITVFVTACGGVLALGTRGHIKLAERAGKSASEASGRLYAAISEHVSGMKLAISYGNQDHHTSAFERTVGDSMRAGTTATKSYAKLRQRLSASSAVVLAATVYLAYRVVGLPVGSLFVLLFLFARLVPRLTSIYEKVQLLAGALPAFRSVVDLERRCAGVAEPSMHLRPREVALRNRIQIDRVTFRYQENGGQTALEDLSLTIPAGATTAIVGRSGAGKSTAADLILGLLEPQTGRVLIDDLPLDRSAFAAWRMRVGYVPQDTFLFHDTIMANLLWAKPGASEREVWRALELAAAEDFVAALPRGLQTVVGDRGAMVSGGERQRIALARALLREPSVLLLDEATSSLDAENEGKIQSAIERLHQRMTIVIVTHRLSTIRNADRIHVLECGRLVQSGTWADLIASPGRFREFCRAQDIERTVDWSDFELGAVRRSTDLGSARQPPLAL